MMYPLQNVQSHKYQTREQFLHDVDLIHQNCEKYNGPGSNYTKTALKMSDLCRERLQEVRRLVISMYFHGLWYSGLWYSVKSL